jgi:hypothetical protein
MLGPDVQREAVFTETFIDLRNTIEILHPSFGEVKPSIWIGKKITSSGG